MRRAGAGACSAGPRVVEDGAFGEFSTISGDLGDNWIYLSCYCHRVGLCMIEMSQSEMLELLNCGLIGRLSMIDATGRPYLIPVRYVWHDGALFVRLAYDGRKQEALERDPHVCFETDVVRADFSAYQSVLVEGTIHDMPVESEKLAALVAYNDKYHRLSGLPTPGPNPVTRGVALRKIEVAAVSGRKNDPWEGAAKGHDLRIRHFGGGLGAGGRRRRASGRI
jgi:nitroimidazol reductase NimA-like FMN-containing flavoprotein (pyridoxamine 5'-phosphate oxidase superfamily)